MATFCLTRYKPNKFSLYKFVSCLNKKSKIFFKLVFVLILLIYFKWFGLQSLSDIQSIRNYRKGWQYAMLNKKYNTNNYFNGSNNTCKLQFIRTSIVYTKQLIKNHGKIGIMNSLYQNLSVRMLYIFFISLQFLAHF